MDEIFLHEYMHVLYLNSSIATFHERHTYESFSMFFFVAVWCFRYVSSVKKVQPLSGSASIIEYTLYIHNHTQCSSGVRSVQV